MQLPPPWEPVIGLEVHVQLKTRTKLFSACPLHSDLDLSPNSLTDPVTLGLPGTLPSLNEEALNLALRLGLALGCQIAPVSWMARKHYFYADLPKGYQISQHHHPLCVGGAVSIDSQRQIPLTRIHLEEDAGKTIHDSLSQESAVDLNRAGIPLVEVVSEPVLRSSEEAVAYLKALHQLVVWLGISDGDLESGNFRCDANVSLRRQGEPLGTRTELKNINSFRFVGLAIDAEIARQYGVLSQNGIIHQETRGWDDSRGTTRLLRRKERAPDYRFMPEPDLGPVIVSQARLDQSHAALPELPLSRLLRFQSEYDLSPSEAETLTQTRERADYYEATLKHLHEPKLVANWLLNELLGALSKQHHSLSEARLAPPEFAALLQALKSGKLSGRLAKEALPALLQGQTLKGWFALHGGQLSDEKELRHLTAPLLEQYETQVSAYLNGKEKVFGFFVGQAMKLTQGKANPELLNRILRELLESRRSTRSGS